MSDEAQQLVKRLLSDGEKSSEQLIARIRALGEAAIPPLSALLEEDRLLASDAPDEAFAPLYAMELLAEFGATQVIPRLFEILSITEPRAEVHGRAIQTLATFGAAALEPCLAAYAVATDPAVRRSIQTALARLGVRDERIYQLLIAEFAKTPEVVTANLARYGDERALPHLHRALDEYTIDGFRYFFSHQAAIELARAIKDLGGTLTDEQLDKVEYIWREQARVFQESAMHSQDAARSSQPAPRLRPGRNDPCWCGSGKKYKKCHLPSDEAR